jgi:hypothetical protein
MEGISKVTARLEYGIIPEFTWTDGGKSCKTITIAITGRDL